jgi:tripartite-type tricarboxylate transporter receptor subunit TctC
MNKKHQAYLCAMILLLVCSNAATAQDKWPSHRVNVIVGFAAGGFADGVARSIARGLGEKWKQPVIVQNMAGAGGNTAAQSVATSAADGYTLLATTTSLAINDTLYRDKGFSSKGLTAVAIPVDAPELLAANPKSGIHNAADMIRVAKEGKLFLGTPGIGTGSHISAEYFLRFVAKVEVKHIPFGGGNPALLALLNGDVNLMASTATAIPYINRGELVGIAVAAAERNPQVASAPTYAELGFGVYEASSWAGFFARVATPEPVLETINTTVNESLSDTDVAKQLQTLGVLSKKRSLKQAREFMAAEITRWGDRVRAIGLKE